MISLRVVMLSLVVGVCALHVRQPILNADVDNLYDGQANYKQNFGTDHSEVGMATGRVAGETKLAQPPGYRSAWDDCGGAGASATERLRSIAATIKGFAKQVTFTRNAAQDCGRVHSNGLRPGPGEKTVYPGPSIFKAATDGLNTAQNALEKYGVAALQIRQPILNADVDNLYDGKANYKQNFGTDHSEVGMATGRVAGETKLAQPPGYRSAWDDCGGAGASATERLRSIAATIKGFAKQVTFTRNAAQDCGHVHSNGLQPGPGEKTVYPGPSIFKAATDGLNTAQDALKNYGVSAIQLRQPILNADVDNLYDGQANYKQNFGTDHSEVGMATGRVAGETKLAQPPGYRSAWDDCGGAGASATERLRSIAATIKGFAKQVTFTRNAAQDCGRVHSNGLRPGPGEKTVYPGPSIFKAATDGLNTAQDALKQYGVAALQLRQPILNADVDNLYDGKAKYKQNFGTDHSEVGMATGRVAGETKLAQPPGYRSAWDDCGGAGASATERLRSIAATIKGFAKQVTFTRNAAQDCGHVHSDGLRPGPGERTVYPGPSIFKAATDGLNTADTALQKYGVVA